MYTHTYTYTCIRIYIYIYTYESLSLYIYIYIERERDRLRYADRHVASLWSVFRISCLFCGLDSGNLKFRDLKL